MIGPYSNNYKPGEIQKDYYVRTLFHLYNPTDIISMISADSFKVYLTGGATWDMMIDNDYSKNKTSETPSGRARKPNHNRTISQEKRREYKRKNRNRKKKKDKTAVAVAG